MYNRDEIIKYNELKYSKKYGGNLAMMSGEVSPEGDVIEFDEFLENYTTEVNYEDDYFYMLNVNRFGDKLLLEFIKLGDEEGFYKDWSYKRFMDTLKSVCDLVECVYVSNYDVSEDEPLYRAFFLSMLIDIKKYENFNQVYFKCANLCKSLIDIAEQRLKGIWWNPQFEKDEMMFCRCFLTPYFNNMKFEKVIFNHGSKEFGKDYILVTTNLFKEKEYYGVQVKSGNISGSSRSDILEITNQIDMAFSVPYKLVDGTELYMSKIIIAISGNYSDNAKEIILRNMDRYKMSNIIFMSKMELNSIEV